MSEPQKPLLILGDPDAAACADGSCEVPTAHSA